MCSSNMNTSCVRYIFEHIMCSITKIDELTNLPKDHWRVLAITNAGRSFILYVDCIVFELIGVVLLSEVNDYGGVIAWWVGWQFKIFRWLSS